MSGNKQVSDSIPAETDDEMNLSQLPANTQAHLAWLRTRMALETTLAAWVRTAASMIGFGFAIVQFLEQLGRMSAGGAPHGPHLARVVGLVLIGAGSLTTAIAIWEYRKVAKYLEGDVFREIAGIPAMRHAPPNVPVWLAVLVCLIGVLAFVLIMTTTELR